MNLYRNWFLGSRPWSFSMTAISVSVGAAHAATDGSFSWLLYIVTLVGMITLHAATNLINDYYDILSGVDYQDTSTAQYRPHPLLEGKLSLVKVKTGAWILYEIEQGGLRITHRVPKKKPVEEYLKTQGRFKHLQPENIKVIQKHVDSENERLEHIEKSMVRL